MVAECFIMDGRTWDVVVMSLEENGAVMDSEKSGRSTTGEMNRDIIGTFFNYTMTVKCKKNNYAEFDAFYDAIMSPIESHPVAFPHNQSLISFDAYITTSNRPIKKITPDFIKWGETTINFIAMKPQITFRG